MARELDTCVLLNRVTLSGIVYKEPSFIAHPRVNKFDRCYFTLLTGVRGWDGRARWKNKIFMRVACSGATARYVFANAKAFNGEVFCEGVLYQSKGRDALITSMFAKEVKLQKPDRDHDVITVSDSWTTQEEFDEDLKLIT